MLPIRLYVLPLPSTRAEASGSSQQEAAPERDRESEGGVLDLGPILYVMAYQTARYFLRFFKMQFDAAESISGLGLPTHNNIGWLYCHRT